MDDGKERETREEEGREDEEEEGTWSGPVLANPAILN